MAKRNIRFFAFLVMLALLPMPAQGESGGHLFWDIPSTASPDEFIAQVRARSGIEMETSSGYANSVYLFSGYAQPITLFGMPVRLSAAYENNALDHVTISNVEQDGGFFAGYDVTAAQQDEAARRGLVGFLEIATQLEEKYGPFTGGQITEAGEDYADFPVNVQGQLDMAAFQEAMWYSNETTLELHNENIMLGLKSYFEYDGDGDTLWCLSLYVMFSYGSTAGRVRAFPGAYPDMGALAASVSGNGQPAQAASEESPAPAFVGKATMVGRSHSENQAELQAKYDALIADYATLQAEYDAIKEEMAALLQEEQSAEQTTAEVPAVKNGEEATGKTVSLKDILIDPDDYVNKYVIITDELKISRNNLSRKAFTTMLSTSESYYDHENEFKIEVFYQNMDDYKTWAAMSSNDRPRIKVRGTVKQYRDSSYVYIDAAEIEFIGDSIH